ncbi:hypothetical protein [Methylicorpusculum sp.]|uniref:hypothetical protein n=1 Tax=Methylicorpusculum sp. TaxID=2713644 RepID=UPI0027180CB4|nr:hypothetical protein [Methylicorpusculum sp.]MDO8845408.1 hypothetical protein [Methylicorpusculum sp.]
MKRSIVFSVILFGSLAVAQAEEVLTANALTAPERTAFSLLSSVMDIVSARIDTRNCFEFRGRYPVTLFANGIEGQRKQNNMINVQLNKTPISVMGYPKTKIPEVGSQVVTAYGVTWSENLFNPVRYYRANYTFSETDDLLEMNSKLGLYLSINLNTREYTTEAITSFNRSPSSDPADSYASYIGWGMSVLSNPEYPTHKYWERFNMRRDEGTNGATYFVKDLLAFRQSCRIKIEMIGHNGSDYISQEGNLTIDLSSPTDPIVTSYDY